MPRIPDSLINSVIYLYPTVQDAERGERQGGTGFLVAVKYQVPGAEHLGHIYAVTAWHVVKEGSPVVRLNRIDGGAEAFALTGDQWIQHPDGDDVAICPLVFGTGTYSYNTLSPNELVTPELIGGGNLGAGDDCFMLGRFADHDGGKHRNSPSARFGCLAKSETERVKHRYEYMQESFLVETRSLSGFSGSPVFAYRSANFFLDKKTGEPRVGPVVSSRWMMLGIDWGHPKWPTRVLEADKETPVDPEQWVNLNSGMMTVIPAWKIRELLDLEELAEMRRKKEELWQRDNPAPAPPVELDAFETRTEPSTNEKDFLRDLRKVTKREPPSPEG